MNFVQVHDLSNSIVLCLIWLVRLFIPIELICRIRWMVGLCMCGWQTTSICLFLILIHLIFLDQEAMRTSLGWSGDGSQYCWVGLISSLFDVTKRGEISRFCCFMVILLMNFYFLIWVCNNCFYTLLGCVVFSNVLNWWSVGWFLWWTNIIGLFWVENLICYWCYDLKVGWCMHFWLY